MLVSFVCGGSSLTAAPDLASIRRLGVAVVTPPAAVDLEDAVVSGSISVVVDGSGVVARLPLGQTNPCRGNRTDTYRPPDH